jgi:hypothetical protein
MGDDLEVTAVPVITDFDDARIAAGRRKPPVYAVADLFDARQRSSLQESECCPPFDRAFVWNSQAKAAVGDEPITCSALSAQFGGGEVEDFSDDPVHLASAREPGRPTDRRNR